MSEQLYSTHICYSDPQFDYKDKKRWADIAPLLYLKSTAGFDIGGIYTLDDLLGDRGIGESYKKRLRTLKAGNYMAIGSDGGGRTKYARRLTEDQIKLLYDHDNLKKELTSLQDELKRLNPKLMNDISTWNKEINKSRVKLKIDKLI
jgi:hypothetical protein